jgi:transcriptional regulator with XRE-family HTH domain
VLCARIPRHGYPAHPCTLGEHLTKYRIDHRQTKKAIAALLLVDEETIKNWEHGKTQPVVTSWPRIIKLLGYDPRQNLESSCFGDRIRFERRRRGWSQKQLGDLLGLDEGTVLAWEAGTVRKQFPRVRALFERFVVESE